MPAIQFWFTEGAFAAFLALVGTVSTLGYAWYRAAVTEQESTTQHADAVAEKEKIVRVKALLGKALSSGQSLINAHNNAVGGAFDDDAKKWVTPTKELIAAAYGDGEALLFLDDSGYQFYGVNIANVWIDGRMRRLSELLRRTDSLPVRGI